MRGVSILNRYLYLAVYVRVVLGKSTHNYQLLKFKKVKGGYQNGRKRTFT